MKGLRLASLALCAAIMVLPVWAIPFHGAQMDEEMRQGAEFPSLFSTGAAINQDFAREFDDWLCDHFAFRQQMIALNAQINDKLLCTSANDEVVVGRNGTLYYAATLASGGAQGLTEEEIALFRDHLALLAKSLTARGAHLYVAIAPDKATVYPQDVPPRYPAPRGAEDIERLRDAARELPLTWIDLITPLREAARTRRVYYRTDTHWNQLGAQIAAAAILRATGAGPVVQCDYIGQGNYRQGDLARLMGLPGGLPDLSPVFRPREILPPADYAAHYVRVGGAGQGALLVMRDSFGTAVAPYLAQAYEESVFRWEAPLEATQSCDDALLLIAQRNLRLYLEEAPILPSALADGEDADEEDDYEMLRRMRMSLKEEIDGL